MNIDPYQHVAMERKVPSGDTRERWVCRNCDLIVYENPRIVVGAVISHQEELLLCRRAIEPRRGYWTVPAGYMELGETTPEGADRELWEEACCKASLEGLLAIYELPHLSQVQMFYRGVAPLRQATAGSETLEVGWFRWDEIPWDELAFETVHWVLKAWKERENQPLAAPDIGEISPKLQQQ